MTAQHISSVKLGQTTGGSGVMELIGELSLTAKGRIAGAIYLFIIIGGFFAVGYVPATIFVPGDAVATAQNLVANESLYRLGVGIHILVTLCNIPLAVLFYDLFKVTNKTLARFIILFILVAVAIESGALTHKFTPLIQLQAQSDISTLTAQQLHTLVNLPIELHNVGFNISLVFVGFYCVIAGVLIFRLKLLPRISGILLVIGGACYIVNGFATFIAPTFAASLFPYIMIPSFFGEASLCLSLLFKGSTLKQ